MKKGFTLIELLIVMVIVGTLVTLALPKYQAALERGRAQEGLANLKAASDLINANYVLNGNSYDGLRAKLVNTNGTFINTDEFAKPRYFSEPRWLVKDIAERYERIVVQRDGEYTLTARSLNGELKDILCTNFEEGLCETIGMEWNPSLEAYQMRLTN